jgi:hypothetical protein
MNRVGLGLAVGAGYLLGRTKKLKLAVAVGTMVAGKKMNLTPRGIADLVSTQLQNNPQFKEIGDQLREDMRGVGKAATGALVERRIDALADRLHGRTAEVRDQVSGVASKVPGTGGRDDDAYDESDDREEYDDGGDERADRAAEESERRPRRGGRERREPDAEEDRSERKAPAKKSAAKKTAAKKAPARKTAAKSAQPARKSVQRAARSGPKGGGER